MRITTYHSKRAFSSFTSIKQEPSEYPIKLQLDKECKSNQEQVGKTLEEYSQKSPLVLICNEKSKEEQVNCFTAFIDESNESINKEIKVRKQHSIFGKVWLKFKPRKKSSSRTISASFISTEEVDLPHKSKTVAGFPFHQHAAQVPTLARSQTPIIASTTSWRRRIFHKYNAISVFKPFATTSNNCASEKEQDVLSQSSMYIESPRMDFVSPPTTKPMRSIDSVHVINRKTRNDQIKCDGEQLRESDETRRMRETSFLPIDPFGDLEICSSLSALYENSFFKSHTRQPIDYDNSQITDETLNVAALANAFSLSPHPLPAAAAAAAAITS